MDRVLVLPPLHTSSGRSQGTEPLSAPLPEPSSPLAGGSLRQSPHLSIAGTQPMLNTWGRELPSLQHEQRRPQVPPSPNIPLPPARAPDPALCSHPSERLWFRETIVSLCLLRLMAGPTQRPGPVSGRALGKWRHGSNT